MGKLNFRGYMYLISRFYPTCEIRKNLMHVKNVFYKLALQSAHSVAVGKRQLNININVTVIISLLSVFPSSSVYLKLISIIVLSITWATSTDSHLAPW